MKKEKTLYYWSVEGLKKILTARKRKETEGEK